MGLRKTPPAAVNTRQVGSPPPRRRLCSPEADRKPANVRPCCRTPVRPAPKRELSPFLSLCGR